MQVRRILAMKGTEAETVIPSTKISDVLAKLAEFNFGALVVSVDGKSIDGIVSERDIVRRLAQEPDAVLSLPVSDLMTTTVHCCSPDDKLDDLMAIMTDKRIRHVPVREDGDLAGMISIGDVVKCRVQELETTNQQLVDYISGR